MVMTESRYPYPDMEHLQQVFVGSHRLHDYWLRRNTMTNGNLRVTTIRPSPDPEHSAEDVVSYHNAAELVRLGGLPEELRDQMRMVARLVFGVEL